jgi:hypothetical protein
MVQQTLGRLQHQVSTSGNGNILGTDCPLWWRFTDASINTFKVLIEQESRRGVIVFWHNGLGCEAQAVLSHWYRE